MSNPGYNRGAPWEEYSISELWRIKCEQEHRISELAQRVSELSAKLANKSIDTVPLSYEIHQLRKIASIVYRNNKKAEADGNPKIELPTELASILKAMFEINTNKSVEVRPSKQFSIEVDGVTLNVNPIPLPKDSGSLCPSENFNVPDAYTYQEAFAKLSDKHFNPFGKKSEPEPPKTSKNAYEIRLDLMLKAMDAAGGDPEKATEIAEKLYKFVEGKRK